MAGSARTPASVHRGHVQVLREGSCTCAGRPLWLWPGAACRRDQPSLGTPASPTTCSAECQCELPYSLCKVESFNTTSVWATAQLGPAHSKSAAAMLRAANCRPWARRSCLQRPPLSSRVLITCLNPGNPPPALVAAQPWGPPLGSAAPWLPPSPASDWPPPLAPGPGVGTPAPCGRSSLLCRRARWPCLTGERGAPAEHQGGLPKFPMTQTSRGLATAGGGP